MAQTEPHLFSACRECVYALCPLLPIGPAEGELGGCQLDQLGQQWRLVNHLHHVISTLWSPQGGKLTCIPHILPHILRSLQQSSESSW